MGRVFSFRNRTAEHVGNHHYRHRGLTLRFATEADVPQIFQFIRELAGYERLTHEMIADETTLRDSLFRGRQVAEVIIAEQDRAPAGRRLGAVPMDDWTVFRVTGDALARLAERADGKSASA